jgi:hypothetical protein
MADETADSSELTWQQMLASGDKELQGSGRELVSLELWDPSRSRCEARDSVPSVFFGLRNEAALHPGESLAFNPYVLLAVASKGSSRRFSSARAAALSIAGRVQAVLKAVGVRPWGRPFGRDGGFADAVGDMMITDVFKLGNPHTQIPSLDVLKEEWKLL